MAVLRRRLPRSVFHPSGTRKRTHHAAEYAGGQYKKMLSTFDIGLSLMSTPHSNMPVIDFALSGNCVVTNCYKNKNQAALSKICKNILAADFNKDALVETLRTAVKDCTDLEKRYQNARESSHPTNWDDVFGEKHQKWLKDIMETHI